MKRKEDKWYMVLVENGLPVMIAVSDYWAATFTIYPWHERTVWNGLINLVSSKVLYETAIQSVLSVLWTMEDVPIHIL